jgi:PAS domain S-box-containing protein
MRSSSLVEALQVLQPFVYGGLFLVALIQWRRRPGRASAWLVATFGVLAAVVIAGQILPEDPTEPAMKWAGKLLLATLVLFPYFLYRFTTSLMIRAIPWVNVVGTVLTSSVAIAAFILPPFPPQDAPTPGWLRVYVLALLVQWVFLSGVVAVRLWRAGKGQPTVARRRMRTLSLGATGLALALVVGGEFSQGGITEVFVQVLVLAAAPLMLIGFAPPWMLRASWRRREEATSREAGLSLMEATTTSEVAQTLLPHARKLVGAVRATLEDSNGAVVASDGIDQYPSTTHGPPDVAHGASLGGAIISVPMRKGRLIVETSSLTPFFGDDELSQLQGLAGQADLALARNELLDSQRRLAAIVESSDDAIVSKTLDGTITSWNRGAERLYGYGAEEVLGKPISILVPAERHDEIPTMLERVSGNGSIEHHETKRRTKEGVTIDVSLTISPIRDGDGHVVGASTIARDVSERKKVEEERESAREQADRANRAKSEFLSRMSHELRTPMNAVLGFAQLLQLDHLEPEQEEATGEILKAGKHLLELIDEVLDIARIEAGRLRLSLEPVDAVEVTNECISLLRPQADHEGVRLSLEPHDVSGPTIHVIADRQRLKQVLLNLISNGIKYNRQQGSVRVAIERSTQERRITIDVTDTGQGIPPERMEQLFAPFERLGAEETAIEGTGLGLALTRPLAEAMGGAIRVTSELGTGSTFSVDLASADDGRINVDEQPSSQDEVAAEAMTTIPRTILYVEDNLSNLKLMERVIARRPGITLLSAMQGSMGVALARDHRPELILLDLNLPDMRGEEVLARLHSDPATAGLPVVVISADATSGQRARLIQAGARDFITKPFDVDRLLQFIDEFCADPLDGSAFPDGSSGSSAAPREAPAAAVRRSR